MNLMAYVSERSKTALLAAAFCLAVLVGVLDALTPPPISFELFYIVPILLASWFVGRWGGVFIAVTCACATFVADLLSTPGGGIVPYIWNVAVQLGVFLVVAQIAATLVRLRRQQEADRIAALKRTDELKTSLLHAVSHDLRTPLSSIKTSATTLLDSSVAWDPGAQRDLLQGIDEESDRLSLLVSNLLDMSRLEGGMLHLERDWYTIDEVIYSTLRRLKPRLACHPVTLHLPEKSPLLFIDFIKVGQALTNIIENAVKYTPPETPMEISARQQDGVVEVEVADYGPGVAQQDLPHLFDTFYRVNDSGRPHGTGLGLSIAMGMVQAHGGCISAKCPPGEGLCVTFTLPIVVTAADRRPATEAGPQPLAPGP
jgi:two-component system sensor histidine kinase KdpD